MKKVFYSLAIFLSIFIINVSEVDALQCKYVCKNCDDNGNDVEFNITTNGNIYVRSSGKFTFGGEEKSSSNTWSNTASTSGLVIGARHDLYKITNENGNVKSSELLATDDCTNYMYYVVNSDRGRNKFYLSNLDYSTLSKTFSEIKGMNGKKVLTLDSYGNYTDKVTNKSLDEMVCTYSYTQDLRDYDADGFYTETYSFKIKSGIGSKTNGSYSVYKNGKELYTGKYSNKEIDDEKKFASGTTYLDYFSIRIFWNDERDELECPSNIITKYTGTGTLIDSTEVIEIGYNINEMNAASELYKEHWYQFYNKYKTMYTLDKTQSYIKTTDVDLKSKICTYTKPEFVCDPSKNGSNCAPELALSLFESSRGYIAQFTNISPYKSSKTNITSGIISEDCNNLPKIYTNCLSNSYTIFGVNRNKQCTISETPFDGNDVVELVPAEWSNTQSIDDVYKGLGVYLGTEYRKNICTLRTHLLNYATYSDLTKTTNLSFYSYNSQLEGSYNITSLPCYDWNVEYSCSTQDCKDNSEYYANKVLKDTYSYCNARYSDYYSNKNNSDSKFLNGRYEECKTFQTFYDSLVENGIINSMFTGCDVYTGELADKINFFLNIIKIAAPIMALVLGLLDFGKAVVAADSAKEMKDAGKRFGRRLVATALLFLVPTLLSVLINIFLGDEINNNPYCGLIDIDNNTTETTTDSSSNIIYDKEDCPGLYIKNTKTCVVPASGGTSSGSSGGISSPNIDRLD